MDLERRKRFLREAALRAARELYVQERESEATALVAVHDPQHRPPVPDTLRECVEG